MVIVDCHPLAVGHTTLDVDRESADGVGDKAHTRVDSRDAHRGVSVIRCALPAGDDLHGEHCWPCCLVFRSKDAIE